MNPKRNRYYTYIRPITKNKFVKTYSSLIFSLITVSIFSYYAIRPTVSTILSLQKSIAEQNRILSTLKQKVNNLVTGKSNYDSIPPSVKTKLADLVPDNPSLPGLIDTLTYAAQTSEATISGLQFQPVILENQSTTLSKTTSLNQVDFSLNVQGSFANLMKLLTAIKRTDRLVTITSINFVKPLDGNIVMSIIGKAYYLKN